MEKFLHSKRNYLFPCVQYALFIRPIVIQVVIIMCHLLMYVVLHALRFSTLFFISSYHFRLVIFLTSFVHFFLHLHFAFMPLCRHIILPGNQTEWHKLWNRWEARVSLSLICFLSCWDCRITPVSWFLLSALFQVFTYPCLWSVTWAAETVELHLWVDFYCLLCFRCLRRLLNYITWFSRSLLSNTSK